jgi:hypothetical protein
VIFSQVLEPVAPGQTIEIKGRNEDSDRFDINLCGGDEENSGEIMLHISVRFGDDYAEIVRNTFDEDGWGDEEISDENPVANNGDFNFTIKVEEEEFEILIDGKSFCKYAYRKPLAEIKRLNIEGEVKEIYEVRQSS